MYWNNPIIELTYPSDLDPIQQSLHNGVHRIFFDPAVNKKSIRYQQTLQHICRWANESINQMGIDNFVDDVRNHYDIANLVKLNIWVDHIKLQGVVKPLLLYYDGQEKYGINNGESRLRALERIDNINVLSAFVCTKAEHSDKFQQLEPVTSFDQFAKLCKAIDGQQFLFRLTDDQADYGIYWYEYDSYQTKSVTPGDTWCLDVFRNFLIKHSDLVFTPQWFDTLVPWVDYKSNN